MPRRRLPIPTYRLHRLTGQAIVRLNLGNGRTRDVLLGRYESPESLQEYSRIVAELRAGAAAAAVVGEKDLTVAELLKLFMDYAENHHYRQLDGTSGSEVHNYKTSLRDLLRLYAHTPAAEVGPRALKTVRAAMIERGWCRKQVNARVSRIRRVFKWAVSEELVPVEVFQALCTVSGLQAGRTAAVEREPVKPVAPAVVDETIPVLNRYVRGLVQLQRFTGCRPGEACRIRRCDIDRSGEVWIYRPFTHKTAWRGKPRTIALGPKAQQLLQGYFTDDDGDFLFSPRLAVENFHASRSVARQTPLYRSHASRNAAVRVVNPKRPARARYTVQSYAAAVAKACEKLHPVPEHLARRNGEKGKEWHARLTPDERAELKGWRRRWRWSPNQLRHTFATAIRERYGLEAAQVLLGHARADVTQVYAERNLGLAVKVAAEVG